MNTLKEIEWDKWTKEARGLPPAHSTDNVRSSVKGAWSDGWEAGIANNHLIVGALDTLAVALTEHGHIWTDGERAIYEQAIAAAKMEPLPREDV